MILIGQYDSPFVRRVGIALTLYELPFEHRPWSVFGDADKVRQYNPLLRVPVLVLDDGESLIESHAILDYLDGLAPHGRVLMPEDEPARRQTMKITMLATATAEQAVSLFYELRMHEQASKTFSERRRSQIRGGLAALEKDRAARSGEYWFGDHISHADIAVGAMLRFVNDAHADLAPRVEFPKLQAHGGRLEALPVFKTISQPFIAPA